MASLTGTKIKDTYDALLKVSDNGALDGTLQTITDGLGNNSALSLSTAGASVGGTLAVSGNAAFDTNTLFVDAANNRVGVGTLSPAVLFQADLGTSGNIAQFEGNSNIHLRIGESAGDMYLNANNGNATIKFQTNGTERMKIATSGDISFRDSSANEAFYWDASAGSLGIGTNNPDIFGRFYTRSVGITSSGVSKIQINGTSYSGIDFGVNGTRNGEINNSGSFEISTLDARAVTITTNGTERMRIDSSGNVGIGGVPNSKLTVSGQIEASSDTTTPSGGNAYFYKSSAGAVLSGFSTIIETGGLGSRTEKMRIDSSGNVGIGGTPTHKLYVRNDVAASTDLDPTSIKLYNNSDGGAAIEFSNGVVANSKISFGVEGTGAGSDDSYIGFSTNANAAAATERMRITSGGYLKASNTGSYASSTGSFHEMRNTTNGNTITNFYHSGTDPYGLFAYFDGSSPNNTSNYFAYFRDVTESKFIVWSNGNVVNRNNSYGAISDAKLKENVVDASPKLEDLMQVKVRNFNYIGDDKKQLGVVAQELEEVFPSMIDESPDYEERDVEVRDEEGNIVYKTEQVLVSEAVLDEEGNVIEEAVYETIVTDEPEMTKEKFDLGTVTKSVKYSVFVPMLIKAIQEQQEIINDLKSRIEQLEA